MAPGASCCVSCGVAAAPVADPNAKSKLAAGLLGIFLGAIGVHNFYTVLSCMTLSFVSGIWGLIEGILILAGNINVDGKGNPLKD